MSRQGQIVSSTAGLVMDASPVATEGSNVMRLVPFAIDVAKEIDSASFHQRPSHQSGNTDPPAVKQSPEPPSHHPKTRRDVQRLRRWWSIKLRRTLMLQMLRPVCLQGKRLIKTKMECPSSRPFPNWTCVRAQLKKGMLLRPRRSGSPSLLPLHRLPHFQVGHYILRQP